MRSYLNILYDRTVLQVSRQLEKISHILFEEKNEYSKAFIVKFHDIK